MKAFHPRSIWFLLRTTAWDWFNHDIFRLSASLSYFTVFSIAPLLIIVLFIIGLFWGDQTGYAQAHILGQIQNLTGPDGAELIRTMLENAERPDEGGLLASILGVGALLFGATVVFVQLKGALNTMWDVEPSGMGVKSFLTTRVLSFGLILGLGFLLIVSLLVSAALSAADAFITGLTPALHFLAQAINLVLSFGVLSFFFALIYRYLPDTTIAWRDVAIGGAITALLFTLGKLGIGLYLGNSGIQSSYGAAGSLAVLLLWVYYSSLIFFFGAEFTQVYATHYGSLADTPQNAPVLLEEPPPKPILVSPSTNPRTRSSSQPQRSALKKVGLFLFIFFLGRFFGRHS